MEIYVGIKNDILNTEQPLDCQKRGEPNNNSFYLEKAEEREKKLTAFFHFLLKATEDSLLSICFSFYRLGYIMTFYVAQVALLSGRLKYTVETFVHYHGL